MIKKASEKTRGFTMVEMVVALALAAVLTIAIADLYRRFLHVYSYETSWSDVAKTGANAAADMQTYALQADAIAASTTINGTKYTTSSSTLVLELPSTTSAGDVVANTYDYVVYYVSSSTLYRILSPNASSARKGETKKLGTGVATTSFSYNTANQITWDLQLSVTSRTELATYHMTKALYIRNN